MDILKSDDLEIGRILHLKSEPRNLKLDCAYRALKSNLRFRVSDLRCRIRPISRSSSFKLPSFSQEDSPTISLPCITLMHYRRGWPGRTPAILVRTLKRCVHAVMYSPRSSSSPKATFVAHTRARGSPV